MLLDLVAEEDASVGKPDLLADLAGHEVVVAGEDLDRDAVRLERLDGRGRALSFGGSRNAT